MDSFIIEIEDDARKFVESLKKDRKEFSFKIPVVIYEHGKIEYNEANGFFRFHRYDSDWRERTIWLQSEDEIVNFVYRWRREINLQLWEEKK